MIMAVKKIKKLDVLGNENGQAIMEFLLFLPFMLMMYSVSMSLSNAINASINQQKITRSYFYYRNMNNSTIPRPRRDGQIPSESWKVFGTQIMGWNEKLVAGENPLAPCFKFALPLGEGVGDSCEDSYSKLSTQYIRVQTVYGVCGATYVKDGKHNIPYPRGASGGSAPLQHCVIVE